MFAELT